MAKSNLPFSAYIAALVLAVAVPLVLLLGYFTYRDFKRSESEAATDVLRSAQLSAARTAGFLRASEEILRKLSQHPRLSALDSRQCGLLLVQIGQLLDYHVNVVTRNAAGKLVCTAVPPKAGLGPPLVSTKYLMAMLRAGKFTVGGPLRSSITGTWVVPLQYPLRDAQGAITGAVVLALDLSKFDEIPSSMALIGGTATRIVTADGILVATSQDPKAAIGRNIRDIDVAGKLLATSVGTVRAFDAQGAEQIYAVAAVPGTDWRVVASTPAEPIFAQSRRDSLHNALVIAALAALVALLSAFLARKLVKAIGNIAEAAAAVAAGDRTVRADPTGPIEIKTVAAQFNQMLDVLDRAEQRLSGIIASAMDPIITIDERQNITLVNAAVEQMFGYSEADLLGKPVSMLIPERSRAAHQQHIRDFARTNATKRAMGHFAQVIGRRAGGQEFPVDASISQMEWAGQRLFTVILRDVTRRIEAENALRASYELLDRIFETTHFCLVYLDRDFNFVRVNQAYANACGYPAGFFPGKNHFDLHPSEEVETIFRNVVATGTPFTIYTNPFRFPDHPERGVTYWDWSLHPLRNEDGGVEGLLFALLDVTERKRSERSNAQLAAIVESSNDAILARGPDRTILSWNAAAERLFGWSAQEAVGQSIDLIVPRERIGQLQPFIARAARGESVSPVEIINLRRDGTRIPTQITLSPVRDKNGRIVAHSYTVRDMTDIRRNEKALDSYAARLRELSRRLQEVQEKEHHAISREIHDRIGQDLTTLALLFGRFAARFNAEPAGTVRNQLRDMQGLLKSTIENVRDVMAELRPPVLDDYGLYAALRNLATKFSKHSGIPVALVGVDLQPRLPSIVETALFRISQEALNNIAKHAQATKVAISLGEDSQRVVLDIADDGVGFDAITAETLQDGPHWGMLTMRERAEAAGITLRLHSAPGAGTRVVLEVERAAS